MKNHVVSYEPGNTVDVSVTHHDFGSDVLMLVDGTNLTS